MDPLYKIVIMFIMALIIMAPVFYAVKSRNAVLKQLEDLVNEKNT